MARVPVDDYVLDFLGFPCGLTGRKLIRVSGSDQPSGKGFLMPRMWRVFVWGLLASLLLHWIVLDLWHGGELFAFLRPGSKLEVRVQQADGIPASVEAPTPVLPPVSSAKRTSAAAAHAPTLPLSGVSDVVPETTVATADAWLPGTRSGSREEAMVALRLSIADSLRLAARQAWPVGDLVCEFDAAGRLQHLDGAQASAAQLQALRQALARVRVPDVLIGSGFALDLRIEP